jgi:dipeptidase
MKKIQKNTYKKIYSEGIKKIGVRKGCWNAKKGHNWLRRFKNAKG